jgi:putative MATE family efflux protein
MVHDMTKGSVRGHVVRMMLFVLAGLVVQTLYSLVDIYWVGRLGKQAVAAVALSTNLMYASIALSQMLSVGCVALVSQAAGRKDKESVQRLFNQAQSASMSAGLFFLAVAMAGMNTYADRLSGDAETATLAKEFLVWFIPALALQFAMLGLASALRGIGDMKPGLIAQIASIALNMILAPFLIFGWIGGHPLGVAGAAISTLVATIAAVIGLAIYLARGSTFLRIRFADWRPDLRVWREMIGIGLPSGAEFILMSFTMAVVYGAIRPFGSQAQAGYGIAARVMQAGFMPAVAISFSVAAVAGQNFGAKAFGRVRETAIESAKLTIAFMLVFTLISQVAADSLVRVFSKDASVIEVGADYLRIVSYNYVGSGLVFVIAGIFQGVGNTWPSLLASSLRCVVFVGPALWLSRQTNFTMHSLWVTAVAAVALQLVMCVLLLRRELRIKAPVPVAA